MSLRDTLETSFSGDGLDADALLQQIADLYRALDLPASAFDPASIADQLQVLGHIDTSDITGLLDSSLQAAGAAIESLPGAGEELAALREAVSGLDALGHGATGLLDGLRDALTGTRPDETPVERAARAMTEIGGVLGPGPGEQVAAALPGAHLDRLGPAEGVLAAAGGLTPALAAIEGLMGIAAGLDRVVALRQAVAGLPDAASIANLRAAAAAWDVSATVDRIASGDPVDAIVADVAPALTRLRDLEQALAALVAGSAAIVGRLDPAAVQVAWRAADGVLGALDPAPVRALAERLTAALGGLLRSVPDATIPTADAFAAEVDSLLGGLTDAMAAVSSDRFTRGIAAGAAQVTAPIQVVADALGGVRSGVLEAEDAVGSILEAIDMTPVTDAIGAVTGPVTAAVEEVRAAFAAVSAALATSATTATGAIGELRAGADEVAATLGDAFGAVAGALDDLDLAARLEQVRAALEPVARALGEVRIADAADAAAQGIESVAAVIDALPMELLPDSARTELDTVTAPLKAFDFDAEVRSRVVAMLEEIESAIDVEVLDQVRAAQTEAAAFIASIDPRPAIEGLERDTFTPALERIHAVDPDAALAPVRDAIARIPDLTHLLDPADQLFDQLLEGYDRFSPRPLLQPVVAPLAAARAAVAEQLRLDATRAQVEAVRATTLEAVDEVNVAHWLDALAQAAAAALPGAGGAAGAPLGQLVLRLTGHDTILDPRTFATALDLVSGHTASTALTESAAITRDALATLRATLGDLDGGSLLEGLQPGYDAIEAAIAALPAGALRRRLDALLPPSPASLATPLARARGDAIEQVTGALTISSQLAAFDLHRIDAAVAGFRDALDPLKAVLDWLLAWVRRAGVVVDPANLAAAVAAALDAIRSRVRGALGLRMQAQLRESLRTAVTAIVEALLAVVDRVSEALEVLDPEPLVAELEALHAAKRTELAELRPSTRLADVVTALRELEHDLRAFDPLADVRPALAAFQVAADAVATELRPSILLAPAIESFERVATTITAADVDHLFGPVLDALHRVTDEVGDGLDDVGMAFGRMQAALP